MLDDTGIEITSSMRGAQAAIGQLLRIEFEPTTQGLMLVNCGGAMASAIQCDLTSKDGEVRRQIESDGRYEFLGAAYNPRTGLVAGWVRVRSLTPSLESLSASLITPTGTRGTFLGDVVDWVSSVFYRVFSHLILGVKRVYLVAASGVEAAAGAVGDAISAAKTGLALGGILIVGIIAVIAVVLIKAAPGLGQAAGATAAGRAAPVAGAV